ncbi:MAG: zinc ribbon domain-containing protein, partial [Bacteroidaceae bacterium]|nr:zinc ribbon domain-containing protein [Bacteroidaceae bacterium]
MNTCKKCNGSLPDGAIYCPWCGKKQEKTVGHRKRGNGQGTVIALPNGKYKSVVVTDYYTTPEGKRRRHTRCQTFDRRKDAVNAIPTLLADPKKQTKKTITFKELYDLWLPTHRAGQSTINCYKAAIRFFEPVWGIRMADIDVDDLQECID